MMIRRMMHMTCAISNREGAEHPVLCLRNLSDTHWEGLIDFMKNYTCFEMN